MAADDPKCKVEGCDNPVIGRDPNDAKSFICAQHHDEEFGSTYAKQAKPSVNAPAARNMDARNDAGQIDANRETAAQDAMKHDRDIALDAQSQSANQPSGELTKGALKDQKEE